MAQDARRFLRADTEAHVHLGFQYGGQRFSDLPMKTLSECGCGFVAPEPLLALMDVLDRSTPVEDLVLHGQGLPMQHLRARVAYTVGHDPVMVGLEFLDSPPAFRAQIARLVHVLVHTPHQD